MEVPDSNALTHFGNEGVGRQELKPPTQSVGVQSFVASDMDPDHIRMARKRIAALPPFQMFAAEKRQLPAALVLQDDAINEYITWHQAKGCWPGETPFGELA